MKLTDIVIRNLEAPPTGAKVYHDDALTGFGVRVTSKGFKAFVLTHGANRERVTIGRYPIIGLADARNAAKRIMAERTLGKHQAPRQTFGEVLDAFLTYHEANNRPGTASEVRRILTKQFATLHRHKLAEVTTHDISRITDKMIENGYPSAANHAHMAVRNFLHWCVRRRHIQHSPLEGLEKPAPTPSRDRVLSDDELKAVWRATENPTTFNTIVRLCLLTGQRRGEIAAIQLPWLQGSSLTIPASVAKNGKQHVLPLSERALSLATDLATTRLLMKPWSDWSKNKRALDKAVDIHWRDINQKANQFTSWTLHDLRRTYATNLQRLGIRLEVIEALLNHVSGTRAGIVGVYQKHRYEAEMRDAVTEYEKWFTATIASS